MYTYPITYILTCFNTITFTYKLHSRKEKTKKKPKNSFAAETGTARGADDAPAPVAASLPL
jgi:hypothetical protein